MNENDIDRIQDPRDSDFRSIDDRNRLRSGSGLPFLDVDAESKRVASMRERVEFEREWERRRPEFAHLWTGNRNGWLTNMGRYSLARLQVRREMKSNPD